MSRLPAAGTYGFIAIASPKEGKVAGLGCVRSAD